MENRKVEKNRFGLWDYPLLIHYLENMAAEGWMLCDCTETALEFEKQPPRKVKFAVTFFPDYDFLDPHPPESLKKLWEFCEANGWINVTDNASMQIFYNMDENCTPLHTDAVVQLENFNAMMKAEKVKLWKSHVIVNGLFFIFLAVIFVAVGNERTIMENLSMAGPVMVLLLAKHLYTFVTDGAKLLNYQLWYKQAKQAALDTNCFVPPSEIDVLQQADKAIWAFYLVAFVFFLFRDNALVSTLICSAVIFGLIGVYIATMRYLKKQGVSAKENRFVSAAILIMIIVLLVMALPHIIMLLEQSGVFKGFVAMQREYPA